MTITDAPKPEDRLRIERVGTADGGELALVGDIDPHTADLLQQAVRDAARASGPLVLDMAGVAFVDSSGLRVLADAQRSLEAEERELVVRNPGSGLRKLLEVTGLADHVRVEP